MSQTNKPKKHIKGVALLVSVLLLVCVTVGGTLAYIITASGPITNLFNPSKVTTEVVETINGETKTNVMIQNTGDTEAYIRAAVIVTWQNEQGNVYGRQPVTNVYCQHAEGCNCDYIIDWGDNWMKGTDGFWYHKTPVIPNDKTSSLIDLCSYKGNAPEGYSLSVEILGSGIQSKPDSVFNDEWGSSGLKVATVDGDRQLVEIGG